MGHNRVRPKYVQAERAVISSGIPVASARGMSTYRIYQTQKM